MRKYNISDINRCIADSEAVDGISGNDAEAHRRAFDYALELADENAPLTESLIRELHCLIYENHPHEKGCYRVFHVEVIGDKGETSEPYQIPIEMNAMLERYRSSEEDFISKIARLHLEFERIHPFAGGNGRTGRLAVSLELMKAGYMPIDIRPCDRDEYHKAFDEYAATGGIGLMRTLFERIVIEGR